MRELTTKFGTLYIEEPSDNRPDKDRYVIEDSRHRWFDYFSVDLVEEGWDSYEDFYNNLQLNFATIKTPEELLDYLGIDAYVVSKNIKDIFESIYKPSGKYIYDPKTKTYYVELNNGEKNQITEESILNNEYVNVIGEWYILVCD